MLLTSSLAVLGFVCMLKSVCLVFILIVCQVFSKEIGVNKWEFVYTFTSMKGSKVSILHVSDWYYRLNVLPD